MPNVDGKVVVAWVALTATGGTKAMTVTLGTYDPNIDIRIGHPVLSGVFITSETDTTGTEAFLPQNEMARGTAPDSTGEWDIEGSGSLQIYQTADQNGFVGFTYIAFGTQMA